MTINSSEKIPVSIATEWDYTVFGNPEDPDFNKKMYAALDITDHHITSVIRIVEQIKEDFLKTNKYIKNPKKLEEAWNKFLHELFRGHYGNEAQRTALGYASLIQDLSPCIRDCFHMMLKGTDNPPIPADRLKTCYAKDDPTINVTTLLVEIAEGYIDRLYVYLDAIDADVNGEWVWFEKGRKTTTLPKWAYGTSLNIVRDVKAYLKEMPAPKPVTDEEAEEGVTVEVMTDKFETPLFVKINPEPSIGDIVNLNNEFMAAKTLDDDGSDDIIRDADGFNTGQVKCGTLTDNIFDDYDDELGDFVTLEDVQWSAETYGINSDITYQGFRNMQIRSKLIEAIFKGVEGPIGDFVNSQMFEARKDEEVAKVESIFDMLVFGDCCIGPIHDAHEQVISALSYALENAIECYPYYDTFLSNNLGYEHEDEIFDVSDEDYEFRCLVYNSLDYVNAVTKLISWDSFGTINEADSLYMYDSFTFNGRVIPKKYIGAFSKALTLTVVHQIFDAMSAEE